jgi:hypothetical protein
MQTAQENRDAITRAFGEKQYEFGEHITQVYSINSDGDFQNPSTPIRILQVNTETIPIGLQPIRFGPSPASGIEHPYVIIEVTPDEFTKVQKREEPYVLPYAWTLGDLIPHKSIERTQ